MQNDRIEEEQLSNQEEGTITSATIEEEKTSEEAKKEESQINKLQEDLAEQKDKYIRLYSDFENFRRRSAKEKIDFLKSANEELIISILPIIDDFERAINAFEKAQEGSSLEEGIKLIYNKLFKTLEQKGLKSIEAKGKEFSVEEHEAITSIPAPDDSLKGKVIDEIEKGYYLNDKVIRFAKVVIGS